MYTLDYYDGSPLKCGVCGKPCMVHYSDGERNDIGFCCLPTEPELADQNINLLAMAIGLFVVCSMTFMIGCQVGAL